MSFANQDFGITMRILLSGNVKESDELRSLYNRALNEAEDLYIASAYLTEWDPDWKLGEKCQKLVFVVGRDFGLTRKAAMLNVLKCIPKGTASFFAADTESGFHPKVVAWKTAGKHYCIIGSSNLSRAGLSANYEANVFSQISAQEFERLRAWIDSMDMIPITKEWIEDHYKEAQRTGGRSADIALQIKPKLLPNTPACAQAVLSRRRNQKAFADVADKLRGLVNRCGQGRLTESKFWQEFWKMYRARPSWRLQGRGLEITGKGTHWRQTCGALVRILEVAKASPSNRLDAIVASEIDRLSKVHNGARGAWLSEMLCHYFPQSYPITNGPVRKWWVHNKLPCSRGATEGQKYAELAKKLRWVLRKYHPSGARDLAELDAAIVRCMKERGLLKARST